MAINEMNKNEMSTHFLKYLKNVLISPTPFKSEERKLCQFSVSLDDSVNRGTSKKQIEAKYRKRVIFHSPFWCLVSVLFRVD